jgi:uncharacterized membrane protein YobD (UPF0266 family)
MDSSVDNKNQYEVSFSAYKFLGSFTVIFFSILGVVFLFSDTSQGQRPWIASCVMFGFVLLGVYLFLVGSGTLVFSEESITHRTKFGVYRIYWHEITGIEYGKQGALVLHGENKRFAINPVNVWSGKQRRQAYELMESKLEKIGLTAYEGHWASAKSHKNVKIPRYGA